MQNRIEVSTRRYEQVYGRKPRGYALWYFRLPGGCTIAQPGTYSEAARVARSQARRLSPESVVRVQLCA